MTIHFSSVQSLSRVQLCDPMNRSTSGLPVHHHLLEYTQTHVHWVCEAICHLILFVPFSSCPPSFPASGSFQMSQLVASGGQRIGVSTSTSVLPINTQDWFTFGWTGWISLQPKGLTESSPTPQVKSINSSVLSFSYSPTVTSIHDHWKKHSLD